MYILNAKRVRDYPRLMLFTTWLILGLNILLHQGWIGAFGQVIGGDFIMFYSTGMINRSNPSLIYDYDTQSSTQQSLVAPTILPGYNPYMNPPFVAPLYSLFTYISLPWAIVIWSLLAIIAVLLSCSWLHKLYSLNQKPAAQPYWQLVIIALSFFPFVEGFQSGQNHWLTLLLVTGIIYSMFTEKWYLTGALGGLLIYKPQFVLGFLIIWLIWKNYKALISFVAVAGAWVGLWALVNGIGTYQAYIHLSAVFMNLPYIPGFPNYLLVTLYGFLTSILPQTTQPTLSWITEGLLVLFACGLAWLAYRLRNSTMEQKIPTIVIAILLPLMATPYALLHDMVILIPVYVLWSVYSNSAKVLSISAVIYIGTFFLTLVSALTGIAWVSLLVLALIMIITFWIFSKPKSLFDLSPSL